MRLVRSTRFGTATVLTFALIGSANAQTIVNPTSCSSASSGFPLTAGQPVTICATGTINNGNIDVGPDGGPETAGGGFCLPGVPEFSLIGEVGGSPSFFIGSLFSGTAPASGTLRYGVNDDNFPDNSGSFVAEATYGQTSGPSSPMTKFYGLWGFSTAIPWTFELVGRPATGPSPGPLAGSPLRFAVPALLFGSDAVALTDAFITRINATALPCGVPQPAAEIVTVVSLGVGILGVVFTITMPGNFDLHVSPPGATVPTSNVDTAPLTGILGPFSGAGRSFNPQVGICASQEATCGGVFSAHLSDLADGSAEQKAAVKCVQTIQKEGSKYAAAHMKLIIKCKASVVKGKGGSLASCNPLLGSLATKDAKNQAKLAGKVQTSCGGKDKTCGTIGDDVPLANINWDIGVCPTLETNDPAVTINDCGDIAPCLVANIQFANHQVANDIGADLFDAAIFGANSDPGKKNNKCQQAAFKELTKFYLAKSKILLKCWTAKTKLKGDDFSDADPCPDTDAATAKTRAGIEKVHLKFAKAICKKCGGEGDDDKNGTCDAPGAPLDFLSGGFVCPSVTVPSAVGPGAPVHFFDPNLDPSDGVDCSAMGNPVVDTLQEYINCLLCVAEYKADCVHHMNNGVDTNLGLDYPNECAGVGSSSCPTVIEFEGQDGLIDAGSSGQAHDTASVTGAMVTVAVSNCDSIERPCGECDYAGPIPNVNANNGALDSQRCSGDTTIPCSADSDCGGSGPCSFWFGSNLGFSAGSVATCITNEWNTGPIGTVNIESGASAGPASVISRVYLGPTIDMPCPRCVGDVTQNDGVQSGTCDGGEDNGAACDAHGTSGVFGDTSLDCRPTAPGSPTAALGIDLTNTNAGTITKTLVAGSPKCSASGFTSAECLCDTCSTAAAEPCQTDADCPVSSTCGGLRCLGGASNGTPCAASSDCAGAVPCGTPGEPTKPNACTDGTCTSTVGNEGACLAGPFDGLCSPTEKFRSCSVSSDCPFPGDTCGLFARECFTLNGFPGDTIAASGSHAAPVNGEADPTFAALFCIGPTTAASVNSTAGLPGPGRLELTGHTREDP